MKCTRHRFSKPSKVKSRNRSGLRYLHLPKGDVSMYHPFLKQIISSTKPVKITWLDAETIGDGGWLELEECMREMLTPLPTVISIGYVLCRNKQCITIADTISSDCVGVINRIPLGMIVSIERLSVNVRRKKKKKP